MALFCGKLLILILILKTIFSDLRLRAEKGKFASFKSPYFYQKIKKKFFQKFRYYRIIFYADFEKLRIFLDSIKWRKNCDFWFFRQNDENLNFWHWSAIAQKRKDFISYHHRFIHIQGLCYIMTYMVFARFGYFRQP